MRIKRLSVRNFRSVRAESLEMGDLTAILGPNGAGKSTMLHALSLFYGQKTQVEPDDFFGRNFADPIEIGVTFESFSEQENDAFASRIHDNEMTVVRVFETGVRNSGRYYGVALKHDGFQTVHEADGAVAKRQAYNALRDQGGIYADLPQVNSLPAVIEAIDEWEAAHPDSCTPMRDEGQFFGFTNVAKGALNRASHLVFIEAVRDVTTDAKDSKGTVVAQLIELLVRSVVQQRDDIRAWQQKSSAEYKDLTSPENLAELADLSGQLSETLKVFYRDAAVGLEWQPAQDFIIPLPTADVLLDDDGFEGPVDRKGHGLQRALILTLLQHLAIAIANAKEDVEEGAEDEAQPLEQTPGLILAIEEPELYQHPSKQRHFASVLRRLSQTGLPNVANQIQVVFASHSPLFVSTDKFDDIRLAKRVLVDGQDFKECRLSSAKLSSVVERQEDIMGVERGSYDTEGFRARLHIINPEVAEGFFADLALLVEGEGDRAAILATANKMGLDLEAMGIAILPVGGKNNLARPALIFQALGIPTYIIWDCDKGDGKAANHSLLRFHGASEDDLFDAADVVHDEYACFRSKLETTLVAEITDLNGFIDEVREAFSIAKKEDVLKSAFAMREVLRRAGEAGQSSGTLEAAIHAIVARAT